MEKDKNLEARIAELEETAKMLTSLVTALAKRTLNNARMLDEGIQLVAKLAAAVQELTDLTLRFTAIRREESHEDLQ